MVKTVRLAEAVLLAGALATAALVIIRPRSPMFTGVSALLIAVGVALATGVLSSLASKRKRQRHFHSRESQPVGEVFERHYANSGLDRDVIVRLWRECASALRVPADKLRPADRFEHELAASDFWASLNDPRDNLARFAMTRAKSFGTTIDLKQTKTVDELIRQLANIERARAAQ